MASDYELEDIYYDVVKALTSYILRRWWYPDNLERGYIERSYREGRNPRELVEEFVKKYSGAVELASPPNGARDHSDCS
jgi:hypothetical protein